VVENRASGNARGLLVRWLDPFLKVSHLLPWQALAALGTVVYAALRIVYGLFYGAFDVRPEEVGFGYTETLAQSATAILILFLLLVILYVLVSLVPLVWTIVISFQQLKSLFKRSKEVIRKHGWKPLLKWLAHRSVILPVFVVGVVLANRFEGWLGWIVAGGAGILLAWLFTIGEQIPNPLPSSEPPLGLSSRFVGWLVSVAVIISVVFFAVTLWRAAIHDADEAKKGVAIPSSGRWLGLFPPWTAQPASVFWIEASPPAPLGTVQGRCVMYLGRANDVIVIYDKEMGLTLRIPSKAVIVTMESSRKPSDFGCPPYRDPDRNRD
jgi:hypothetical protein